MLYPPDPTLLYEDIALIMFVGMQNQAGVTAIDDCIEFSFSVLFLSFFFAILALFLCELL